MTGAGIFPRIRRHWLLGNASLEISCRAILQGGVQPPVVVIAKIPAERESQPPLRLEASAVDDFGLQRMKERFHVCVVAGGPPARGTLADAQGAESIAKRVAGIFAASIAMENQSRTGMPTTHRCIEDSAR